MIRADHSDPHGLSSSDLPPAAREGPARLLFLSQVSAGFRTYAFTLREYAARREDVDAVFVNLPTPRWMKWIGASLPVLRQRGWDLHSYRHLVLWRRVLRELAARGPLDLHRFDVIHIMTQGAALVLPEWKRRTAARLVVNIDGTAQQDVEAFQFSAIARAPFIEAERRMFRSADLIVCRNRWAPESLDKDYRIPEERIHVARNAIELPERSRWDHPAEPNRPVRLVMVGNDINRKGVPELIDHHQRHLADISELHIVSDEMEPGSPARNIIVHGHVDHQRLLHEMLPSMDIFVLWTKRDHQPWAILEAACVGLPIVSTRLGAIPDLVRDGETGFLREAGDWEGLMEATRCLIHDFDLRERFGRAAREHIAVNFNADREFNRLFDRLVRLADQPR